VPGAAILLHGSYNLRGEDLDFDGQLRMKARISQTVTGTKSFFLKAIDPFFAKNGAGAVIPISISGKRDAPVIGMSVFHKKFERKIGDSDKERQEDKDKKKEKDKS
jgi:VCBS repeat-containing protein